MKNTVTFDTSNKPFSEIMGNGKKYNIPKYQRDYSWGREQWEELWQDIVEIDGQKPANREEHYMGYLVLQKQGINEFKVIDGQQRLTTLSLLILAALHILKGNDNDEDKERSALIRRNYISTKSAGSLEEHYKLELNRNNDEYYRNDLANLSDNPGKRNIKKTEHLMRQAKGFYQAELVKLKLNGQQLGGFIEDIISNYLLFTVITVGDDVNAYKIFETLNARGVQLSTPDLLKNHLFSIIDPRYENKTLIEQQEEKWSSTLNNLGTEDFSRFLRCFWNSRHRLASKTNLFKKIKTTYTTAKESIDVLQQLKESASVYAALRDENDELWRDIPDAKDKQQIRNCLLSLRVFNIVQPYTVLLSAHLQGDQHNFAKVCQWLNAFCIRYHAICKLPPRDVENFYNAMAIDIYNKASTAEIKAKFKEKLPDDDTFSQHFATKTLATSQSTKKAHYLLASLENYLNPNNKISLQGSDYTVEHILPEKGERDDDYWRQQFGDLLEQHVSRLGNLTLLSKKANKEAGTQTFPQKKAIYQQSSLAIVKRICEYDKWDIDKLNAHQKLLAKTATQIWKIN